MFNLATLGSLASQLHHEFRNLFYVLLPLFFAVSLVIAWFKNPAGGPEFIDSLKRVITASILLAAFPEISDAIILLTKGLAEKISDMNGLDAYLKMVSEKAHSYPMSPMSAILAIDDFFMAVLSYFSYFVLYLARYLMVAVYHFIWTFLIIMSPILLLFHVFTSQITMNLFRALIEVASWQIVWAVLAAMLTALPYGDFTAVSGGYLTLIILNFIIAIALFLTPFLVHATAGQGFAVMASSLVLVTQRPFIPRVPSLTNTVMTKAPPVVSAATRATARLTTSTLRNSRGGGFPWAKGQDAPTKGADVKTPPNPKLKEDK